MPPKNVEPYLMRLINLAKFADFVRIFQHGGHFSQ